MMMSYEEMDREVENYVWKLGRAGIRVTKVEKSDGVTPDGERIPAYVLTLANEARARLESAARIARDMGFEYAITKGRRKDRPPKISLWIVS